jgi:transcriptional regulator with XRE-family HTH domain
MTLYAASPEMADTALLHILGTRIARLRVAQNLTQAQLAERAGLGLRTVQRLEQGEAATQLSGFVRVCRALGVADGFDVLLPEPPISPLAQLKSYGKQRKRASAFKIAEPTTPWKWGDET